MEVIVEMTEYEKTKLWIGVFVIAIMPAMLANEFWPDARNIIEYLILALTCGLFYFSMKYVLIKWNNRKNANGGQVT